jgi:hypothetical protein
VSNSGICKEYYQFGRLTEKGNEVAIAGKEGSKILNESGDMLKFEPALDNMAF